MMMATHLTNNAMNRELMNPQSYGMRTTQTAIDEPSGPSVEYLAGFFDGEGSIYAARPDQHIPQSLVQVVTTRQEEPEYYHQRWGGSVSHSEGQEENHSDSWTWRVSGENARIAVEQMLPYLRGKTAQAELFLEAIAYKLQERQGASHYPPEAREPLTEYANELRGMSADRGGKTL